MFECIPERMEYSVIKSRRLEKWSKDRGWKRLRCMIVMTDGLPYLMLLKSHGRKKMVAEISPSVQVEYVDGERSFHVIFSLTVTLALRSNYPPKARSWVDTIRELAGKCHYTMENFDIISVIGQGHYGKVLLCQKKGTTELVAIKTVKKSRLVKSDKVHEILGEKNSLARVRHPFVVGLRFTFQTPTKFYIGLEFVVGGELFKRIQDDDVLPADDVRLYVAEISLALEYMHRVRVIYRDLKPENVLICSDGHVKLADFGLAKIMEASNSTTMTFCGTPECMAPEMILDERYDTRVDWWTLGSLTYELLYGDTPFRSKSRKRLFRYICQEKPKFPAGADPDAVSLISGLLQKKPQDRMTFEEIKKHPFFKGMKFKDVLQKKITPNYIPPVVNDATTANFNSDFTGMSAVDSIATPVGEVFTGFSWVKHSQQAEPLLGGEEEEEDYGDEKGLEPSILVL